MSEREYLEEEDLPGLGIPHGWVVGRDDEGRIYMEEDDSGGSPGSWPIDDEDGQGEADNVAPAIDTPDPRYRGIGPVMRDVLEFIKAHPGCTKAEVRQVHGRIGRNAHGVDSIDRLARRDLVYNLGRPNKHAWYVWQEPEPESNDRPDGMWTPGHP